MKLLLDTHVFLWYISADSRLPLHFRHAIQDVTNEVLLSVASVWEGVIKQNVGKLPLPAPAEEYMPQQRAKHQIASLPIEEPVLVHLAKLPPLHRDPFDRIMVAQAILYDLTVATVDDTVKAYPIKLLAAPVS